MAEETSSSSTKSINELSGAHKEQMAFILGAGPSLHFQDLEPLHNYVTFAVNSGLLKMPDCDYFVTDDGAAADWNYFRDTAKNSHCKKLLFRAKLKKSASHFRQNEVFWYDHVREHSPDFDGANLNGYEMGPVNPLMAARTSAGSAVHAAHIMGCSPIVLLGCDSCHKYGKRYFWQFPKEEKAYRVNDSRPPWTKADRGQLRGKPVDQHCIDFDVYWKRVAKANPGVNIIYASEGGLIDAFPSMKLTEVLKRLRRKKN